MSSAQSDSQQPKILYWDDEIIRAAAWRLCEADGYTYGRGPVENYEQNIANVIMALEQGADDVREWAEADAAALDQSHARSDD